MFIKQTNPRVSTSPTTIVSTTQSSRYLMCIDSISNKDIVYVYDKQEQSIVHKGEDKPLNQLKEEALLNYSNPKEVSFQNLASINFSSNPNNNIIQLVVESNLKKPTIQLHIKRLGQIYDYMESYSILLELTSSFNKRDNKTFVYLYNDQIEQGELEIIYDYKTGIYTYSYKDFMPIKSYQLEEIFQYMSIQL